MIVIYVFIHVCMAALKISTIIFCVLTVSGWPLNLEFCFQRLCAAGSWSPSMGALVFKGNS